MQREMSWDEPNTNLILDSRVYQVEFHEGKVTELTSNIIAKSMYVQCDADGNNYS